MIKVMLSDMILVVVVSLFIYYLFTRFAVYDRGFPQRLHSTNGAPM